MFLVPALIAAGIYELTSAAKTTEKTKAPPSTKPMVKLEAENFNQSDLVPVGNKGSSIISAVAPSGSITTSLINNTCNVVSSAVPYIPKAFTKKVCVEALNLGFRNRGKIIDYVVSKYKSFGTRSMAVGKSTRGGGRGPSANAPSAAINTAPVSKSVNVRRTSKPKTRSTSNGVVITHTEMITSVLTGVPTSNVTAFNCVGYRLNPGVSSVFPWLSSVATNYEKYRFRKLSFAGVPLVATNYSGRYGIGMDYDSTDPEPADRQEFYALSHQVEAMPWDPVVLSIPTDKDFRFTGTHTVADSKLIDLGQVMVMSDAVSNGGTISSAFNMFDLVVSYEVELIMPQQALFATQTFATASSLVAGQNIVPSTTVNVIGPNIVSVSPIVTSASRITVTLPYGNYLVNLAAFWSSGTATTNVTGGTGVAIHKYSGAGASFALSMTYVRVSTSEGTLLLDAGTVAWNANLTTFNLSVSRIAPPTYTGVIP